MDEKLRNQLTGAIIWFVLLIVVVGHWYSHPVNFDPDSAVPAAPQADKAVIVAQPLRVSDAKQTDAQPHASPTNERGSDTTKPEKTRKNEAQAADLTKKPASVTSSAERKKEAAEKVGDPPVAQGKKQADSSDQGMESAKRAVKASNHAQRWLVKVAAYFTARQANDLVATLNEQGYDATYRKFMNAKGQTVYSVRLAPVDSKEEALRLKRIVDKRFHTNSIIEPLPPQS
ncbi:Cell division protein FtsN [Sulfurivirga caldicuralii]|uniref:Cell division protein FtsN n=1 Tax=Sulfurivirga caldicuralii TaxID=364032 RepID=A0A1N6ESM7_9GAMM|nr:SPOR domain-containing protein [Sulfurivirga caldicuralii]SIN86000.1 Cell division protein FtsN [Sulfurivirga caldicuralii]